MVITLIINYFQKHGKSAQYFTFINNKSPSWNKSNKLLKMQPSAGRPGVCSFPLRQSDVGNSFIKHTK
jgi:hypothetical protein